MVKLTAVIKHTHTCIDVGLGAANFIKIFSITASMKFHKFYFQISFGAHTHLRRQLSARPQNASTTHAWGRAVPLALPYIIQLNSFQSWRCALYVPILLVICLQRVCVRVRVRVRVHEYVLFCSSKSHNWCDICMVCMYINMC